MNPVVLPVKQVEHIEQVLEELQTKSGARYVYLADISGQLIAVRGRLGATDIVTLSALTASNMAATSEMARLIGEKGKFRLLLHEGDLENIFLSHVGASFCCAVAFSAGIQIGLVRLLSKRAVEELNKIAAEYENVVTQTPAMMEAGFGAALDDELDRLMPGD